MSLTLHDQAERNRHLLGVDLFEGGRITPERMREHSAKLVEFFGVDFDPGDIRRDSTLLLGGTADPTAKKKRGKK